MSFVDAHQHVWDLAVRDQPWITEEMAAIRRNFTAGELASVLEPHGVRRSVVVQTVTVTQETPELLRLADADGPVAAVVGWTDLTAPDVAGELARLAGLPGGRALRGIRHQVQEEADPDWLTRPAVLRGLRQLADAGLAYDLVVAPEQLPAAVRAASLVPETTFVLDHCGKPPIASGGRGAWEAWTEALRDLAALPNTVCKLSGLVTEADWRLWTVADLRPYADIAVEAFGARRLMFGSDWPVCTVASDYTGVLRATERLLAGLSETERARVFGGTAEEVYHLGEDQR